MQIRYINNDTNHDFTIGNQQGHNVLGLRPQDQQKTVSIWQSAKAYFGYGSEYIPWISQANSQRIALMRAAYVDIFHDLSVNHSASKTPILALLTQFNQNTFDYHAEHVELAQYQKLTHLKSQLSALDEQEYQAFLRTVLCEDRTGMPQGLFTDSTGCDEQLAKIVTIFTYLYGQSPKDSPLWVESADQLIGSIDTAKLGWQRDVVTRYMARVAMAIQAVSEKTVSELNMSFDIDDVKHKAVVRLLKIAFNQLSYKLDYGQRFQNVSLPEGKRAIELTDYAVNNEQAHQNLQSKQAMRAHKKRVFWFALVSALLIAIGQVAIAVGASVGGLAIVIGLSAGFTNSILYSRNIRGVILAYLRGELTDPNMSAWSQLILSVFAVCSFATGIVSGAFAFEKLIALSGLTIATAPGIMIMSSAIIAGLTVLGLSFMLFRVGVGFVNTLRAYGSVSALFRATKQNVNDFFRWPQFNQSILDIQQEVKQIRHLLHLETQNHRGWNVSTKKGDALLALLGQKQRDLNMKKIEHHTRAYLSNALKLIFSLFAVAAAFVATHAFITSSGIGTKKALLATGRFSESMATRVTSVLKSMAVLVNGSLNLRYLVGSAPVFAGLMAKGVTQIIFGVYNVARLLLTGRLVSVIAEGVEIYQSNPYKHIIPGARLLLALGITSLIVFNAIGNGSSLSQKGSITMPAWFSPATAKELTFIMVTSASGALNSSAFREATGATQMFGTPMLNLSYHKVANELDETQDSIESYVKEQETGVVVDKKREGQSVPPTAINFFGALPRLSLDSLKKADSPLVSPHATLSPLASPQDRVSPMISPQGNGGRSISVT